MTTIADQPPPQPGEGDVWKLVIADMEERHDVGIARYGTPVQPFNGRNSLVDAYQEALDLVVYLRQKIEEDRADDRDLDIREAIETIEDSRQTHVEWIASLESGRELPHELIGDISHHQNAVDRYDQVLELLRAL